MKALKNLLLIVLASTFLVSCDKIDLKDLFDKGPKDEISKSGLILSGNQEVPVRTTAATGSMNVTYNKKTKVLTYKITWNNLTGNPIGSHIHGEAPRGVNAPIKHDFTALLPKTISGTFTNSVLVDEVAIKEAGLLSGLYYVNIHTPTFPGGEIRGQIEFN
ncbi:MAG TPA: CHRD domain-containing protein [Chitinophagaceae bacterium]|nr:CHRD domain-containing protein [Chitinophagaceae bacterium]